MTEYIGENLS